MYVKLRVYHEYDKDGNIDATFKEIQKTVSKLPKWIDSKTGEVLGIEYFRKVYNIYPIVNQVLEYDSFSQYLKEKPLKNWVIQDNTVMRTYTVEDKTLESLKASHSAALLSLRYSYETGGMDYIRGSDSAKMVVHTDRESVAKFTSSYVLASNGVREDGAYWKMKNGFFSVSNDDIIGIGNALYEFVQSCYTNKNSS